MKNNFELDILSGTSLGLATAVAVLGIPLALGRTVNEPRDPAVAARAESFSKDYSTRTQQLTQCLSEQAMRDTVQAAPHPECPDASTGAP